MSLLVLVPPVHVISDGDKLRADSKFLTGLERHVALWDGPVRVLLHTGTAPLPFSRLVDKTEFAGELQLLEPDEAYAPHHFAGADVVLGSGDGHDQMDLPRICAEVGARLVYAVEYTMPTRLRTALLDPERGLLRRVRSAAWVLKTEYRRRAAFKAADGLQFNGYPAQRAYGTLDPDNCLYFDGRMSRANMASADEMATRAARLASGQPVRLIFSGRLEPMKGAQDLLPAARIMMADGVDFTLDIFGAGSLAGDMRAVINSGEFAGQVRLHDPVDYEAELVPFMRTEADIFLSCHRQGDPSCSYLEAMNCGLAVIGTNNEMWSPMAAETKAGWVVPMGVPKTIATLVDRLSQNRAEVIAASQAGHSFAFEHDFEREFAHRMAHLARFARA